MYNPRYPGYQPPRVSTVGSSALLGQVLGITGVGFLITSLAVYLFRGISYQASMIAMIGGLVLLFVMQAVRRNPSVALLWFYAFAFIEGIGIAPLIAYYARLSPEVVFDAAATTGFGMLVLGGVAFTFSMDWRRFQGIAFGALILLVLAGIASLFFHFISPTTYSWLTLAVFTVLLLADFSRIRAGGDGLTPVDMAVSIYLDGLNIFLALLQLFGARSRDD